MQWHMRFQCRECNYVWSNDCEDRDDFQACPNCGTATYSYQVVEAPEPPGLADLL